jgi:sulfatase maturation enzyme AslB (radical SAM superfamily)
MGYICFSKLFRFRPSPFAGKVARSETTENEIYSYEAASSGNDFLRVNVTWHAGESQKVVWAHDQ